MGINGRIQILTMGLVLTSLAFVVIAMSFTVYRDASDKAIINAQKLATRHALLVTKYFNDAETSLNSLIKNTQVQNVMDDFLFTLGQWEENKSEIIRLYVTENPYIGQRERLADGEDNSIYTDIHKQHHGFFSDYAKREGYQDIYFVTPDGTVLYNVYKKDDFGINLTNDAHKNLAIATVFNEALAKGQEQVTKIQEDKTFVVSTFGAELQSFYSGWVFHKFDRDEEIPTAFLAQPLLSNDHRLLGVMIAQLSHQKLQTAVTDERLLNDRESVYLVREDLTYLTEPRYVYELPEYRQFVLQEIMKSNGITDGFQKGEVVGLIDGVLGHHEKTVVQSFSSLKFRDKGYAVIAEIDKSVAVQEIYQVLRIIGQIVLIVLVIMLFIVKFVSRSISRPMQQLTVAMKNLAAGEKDVNVDHITQKGEIGDIISAFDTFKEQMLTNEKLNALKEKHDVAEKLRLQQVGELVDVFKLDAEDLLKKVSSLTVDMKEANQSVLSAAKETYDFSDEIATITSEATDDVQMVATATSEMFISIKEISGQMQESLGTVQKAANAVQETDDVVRNMSKLSDGIGDIISLINDIAGQTNLLALNATIEAARAGEAGKGFAVVANEVKNLANQTTKATEDISGQVNSIRDIAQQSVRAMDGVHEEISTINEIIGNVTAAVEEQSVTTGEINNASTSASTRTTNANEKVTSVSRHAKQTLEQSERMNQSVQVANQSIEDLQEKVQSFLDELVEIQNSAMDSSYKK